VGRWVGGGSIGSRRRPTPAGEQYAFIRHFHLTLSWPGGRRHLAGRTMIDALLPRPDGRTVPYNSRPRVN